MTLPAMPTPLRTPGPRRPRRARQYRIRCAAPDGRRFDLEGVFPSDWLAIEHALDQGAAVAIPRMVQR